MVNDLCYNPTDKSREVPMRNQSHALMGRILLREYLSGLPKTSAKAFLLGCTQPDKNPTTYLKGSIRSHWMRGHNYSNASRFMMRLALRLDGKHHFTPWDCYCLGKLMHYTLDAFTFAHDERFPQNLKAHRRYEARLQNYFLAQVRRRPLPSGRSQTPPVHLLCSMHTAYSRLPGSIETDTDFAFRTCCLLAQRLTGALQSRQKVDAEQKLVH